MSSFSSVFWSHSRSLNLPITRDYKRWILGFPDLWEATNTSLPVHYTDPQHLPSGPHPNFQATVNLGLYTVCRQIPFQYLSKASGDWIPVFFQPAPRH